MRNEYFKLNIDAMRNKLNYKLTTFDAMKVNYKLTTFDRQAVIDDIDNLIRQLKITKEGISGAPDSNYRTKRHAAEWLFEDSKQLNDIIEKLTDGEYDND